MNTLLVVPDIFAGEGGIARIMRLYLMSLCESARESDTVDYVALIDRAGDEARAERYSNSRLGRRLGCNRSKVAFIRTILFLGWKTDRIICGHLHHLVVVWFLSLFRRGLPYYVVAHGIDVWRPYTWLEKRSLRGAHRVFCISEYTRRQMLRFDPGLDQERLVIVPNTFDPAFAGIEPSGKRKVQGVEYETRELEVRGYSLLGASSAQLSDESSRLSGFPAGPNNSEQITDNATASGPRLLCVSRLVATDPYKGVDTMIEAMPAILREFPSAQLRIVGGGDDRPRLQALADSLGLSAATSNEPGASSLKSDSPLGADSSQLKSPAVTFTGIVDDAALAKEYQLCDIFALPSRKEGFGLVYLEAMSYGKPCLAARAGGAPEVVTDEVGAVVEYGNVDQIAMAVADLVHHPRDPDAMLRRAGEYSFPKFKERLETVVG